MPIIKLTEKSIVKLLAERNGSSRPGYRQGSIRPGRRLETKGGR